MHSSHNLTDSIVKGFLFYLKKNKQEYLLDDIIAKLKQVHRESDKVLIVTPVGLTQEKSEKAINLAKKVIHKDVLTYEFIIEPGILDGMKIIYKDKLWDFTLQSQVDDLVKDLNT